MTGAAGRAPGLRLALLFLLLALPTGCFLAGAIPLGQVADELAHVLRADAVAGGELCGVRRILPWPNGNSRPFQGVIARFEFIGSVASPVRPGIRMPELVNRAELRASEALRFGSPARFNVIGTIAGYFPVFYVPGALAIEVARGVGAGPNGSWYAVRVANLLCAAAIGALAVALARRGGLLIAVALLLPASLALAASANEDGLVIAASALATAAATRLPAWQVNRDRFFWLLAGTLLCICLAKPPYVGLLVLLFVRPPSAPAIKNEGARAEVGLRLAVAAAIGLAAAAWAAFSLHRCGAPVFRAPAAAGPLWPGPRPLVFDQTDAAAQWRVLLARPRRLVTLALRTAESRPQMLGEVAGLLGWLNFAVPQPVRIASIAALAVAAAGPLALGRGGFERGAVGRGLLVLAGLLVSADLIFLALYLTWTPVGAPFVEGMQGRYLLPLLPPLALAIPARTGPPAPAAATVLALVPLAASLTTAFWLPPAVIRFYYFG